MAGWWGTGTARQRGRDRDRDRWTYMTRRMTAMRREMRKIWSRVASLTIAATASVPVVDVAEAPRSSAAKKAVGRSVASTLVIAERGSVLVRRGKEE